MTWSNSIWHIRLRADSPAATQCSLRLWSASDAELTPSQKFRVTSYIPVIDQFVVSLAHRLSAYDELCFRFGFLGKLGSLSPVEIESSADNLVIVYKDDQ